MQTKALIPVHVNGLSLHIECIIVITKYFFLFSSVSGKLSNPDVPVNKSHVRSRRTYNAHVR